MTFDERVRALEPLRLTPRQARFVVMVALHSGYCLRRQYMAFAGLHYGRVVRQFLDHLVARRLAVRETCRADRGYLYHLQARAIYRALRQEDNRNRRSASLAAIGRKLMLLDFVIAQPKVDWFATEDDKVEFFTTRCQVPRSALPQRTYAAYDERTAPTTRYFVQKLPIFVVGEPPVVHFVTLALETTGDGFERFLRDHARLLSHLPRWELDVVAPAGSSAAVEACRAVFDGYALAAHAGPLPADADVTRYFTVRRALEHNDVAHVSVADLNWFRESRQRFATSTMETRFARWLVAGDRALEAGGVVSNVSDIGVGRFVSHELPFTYQQFGDLAGVC